MKRILLFSTVLVLLIGLLCGCKAEEDSLNQVGAQTGNNITVGQPGNFDEFLEDDPKEEPKEEPQDQPQNQPEPEQDQPQQQAPSSEPEPEQPQAPRPEEPNPAETVDYTAEGWLTVCSYNVKVLYYDHSNDGNGSPMSKFDAVCEELKKIDADIVGLQELDRFSKRCGVGVDQLEMLAKKLGYNYWYYTKTVPSSGGEYGHGILSRYPIKKKESNYFADYNIDAPEPRGYSRSEISINGKTLVFYNTHLAGQQGLQMMHITTRMEKDMEKGKYAVLTGDMNHWPKELEGYIDADYCTMLNTVKNPQNTTYQAMLKYEINGIDNIVVTNNLEHYWDSYLNTGIKVVETSASDHLPIYTYIKMK